MRILLVTTLVLGSVAACSSDPPIREVRIPAPEPEQPDEPDRNIAEPDVGGEAEESPSKSRASATPALSPGLAKRSPIALARAHDNRPTIVACGKSVCGPSEYCCNESCGICAPEGGACTQQVCEPGAE